MRTLRLPTRRRRRKRRGLDPRALVRLLPQLVLLIARLLRDRRVSGMDKALFGVVIAYVLAPIDLMPDFLGALGLVDDLYLVALALGRLLGRAGPDLLLEHWSGDPRMLGYLIESVDRMGSMLPEPVRKTLHRTARKIG
jgi:uncharacterized membrane protein YkvA (DUF1232 family)